MGLGQGRLPSHLGAGQVRGVNDVGSDTLGTRQQKQGTSQMKRELSILLCAVMLLSMAAIAQRNVPVEGAPGATLGKIAGTETLVTVVLKPSGAKDTNLRIVGLMDESFGVLTAANVRYAYRYDDVEKVIVQGGRVDTAKFSLSDSRALSADQKAVLDQAIAQSKAQFDGSNRDQEAKIQAASTLAANGEPDALDYLRSLADSNDLRTRFDAALALYLVGEEPDTDLLRQGLASASRTVRAKAATLSGLVGYDGATIKLSTMLQDRRADTSAPAAKALARLGDRSIIPTLLNMIDDLDIAKGEAAVFALGELGGEDVIQQMKLRIDNTQGLAWFRMARVLHNLGDPLGRELLVKAYNSMPTMKVDAARLLVAVGDWDATQFLRSRMDRREDPTYRNLVARAKNAAVLFESGDFSSKVALQQLATAEIPGVRAELAGVIVTIGDRNLYTVLQPLVEDVDPKVSRVACMAATALAKPEFRRRLLAALEEEVDD